MEEFDLALPVFHIKYADLYEPGMACKGKPCQFLSMVNLTYKMMQGLNI